MKKFLVVIGTRPEAIKMIPLIKELEKSSNYEVAVCSTSQHKEMLKPILEFFDINISYDLEIMEPNQTLFTITSRILLELNYVLEDFKPDLVFVHGDTTTAMSSSIASFYKKIQVAHIEAGLRTYNNYSPFPEEINRKIISQIASLHFAPTEKAKENLIKEGNSKNVYQVGNTVIDSLFLALQTIKERFPGGINHLDKLINPNKKLILVTGHRRENFGLGLENICKALTEIALKNSQVEILYPVHMNPQVKSVVESRLKNIPNIKLIKPLNYHEFIYVMNKSYMILTDSGGIQEEAPSLGKPVLVMRDETERPEGVEAGVSKLVGTDINKIVTAVQDLMNIENYSKVTSLKNPYGNGDSAEKINKILDRYFV